MIPSTMVLAKWYSLDACQAPDGSLSLAHTLCGCIITTLSGGSSPWAQLMDENNKVSAGKSLVLSVMRRRWQFLVSEHTVYLESRPSVANCLGPPVVTA